MREIRFRGKAIEAYYTDIDGVEVGDWVEGYYYFCREKNGAAILTDMGMESGGVGSGIVSVPIKVDPKTVGQSTGLHDKNGKEIYEWEVLRSLHFVDSHGNKHYLTHYIVWKDELTGWYAQSTGGQEDGSCQLWVYLKNADEIEIIGNIHENPELLTRQP